MQDMHGNSPKILRQQLLAQRKQFANEPTYGKMNEALLFNLKKFLSDEGEHLPSIALYWPIQDEPDLRPTLQKWADSNPARTLCLPFARPDKQLDFYTWQEKDTLLPSQHGVPEPDPQNLKRPLVAPDCILIPCVGWSESLQNGQKQYWRLGYGGGYFDRTLEQLRQSKPTLVCVGIGFSWQQLHQKQWQAKSHDQPLDLILTEAGLLR